MAQEDKLKREIDLIGKLLAKLFADLSGRKNISETNETYKIVQQSLQDQLALDLDALTNASSDEFKKLLKEKAFGNLHLEQLADILDQLAARAESEQKSHKLYEKALLLYEELARTDTSYSLERHYKIERIKKLL